MKKALFVLLFLPLGLMADIGCECGTHETGIYTYQTSGPGCCTSTLVPGSVGQKLIYVLNQGVWQFSHREEMSALDAKTACCPPA